MPNAKEPTDLLPLIGITCSYRKVQDGETVREEAFVYKEYFDAVAASGGLPFLLPPLTDDSMIREALERIDGLLLVGGADMNPAAYGQPLHPKTRLMEPRRDRFDLTLAGAAIERSGLPILGICQGCQLLNVAHGGDLIQDLPDLVPGAAPHAAGRAGHHVLIADGTRLKSIAERERICVNSHHHQAIGRVGSGLAAAARCEADGMIEAIETDDDRFLVGVQWHPESGGGDAAVNKRLFEAFLTEARVYAGERR